MKAIRLRTEYLKNPIGIDILTPRLMWNCEGGITQSAYQIIAGNWDSGKVQSSSMQAQYPEVLKSRERVNWKIRMWDENDESGFEVVVAREFVVEPETFGTAAAESAREYRKKVGEALPKHRLAV